MAFSYDKLWKLIIDMRINKTTLRDKAGITSSSLARLSKNENVSMDVLDRICTCLDCKLEDIVEHVRNKSGEY
ncbi:helix-turn-helix transcriptional regulator (plasmid) [Arthrobacter citreus]|nr:helix-turn-helix transcriptional regulator [Arthrobacter citreus]